MKQVVNPYDYAAAIAEAMKHGILLTTRLGDKVNTMTIGWGSLGVEWGRPIFTAYIRESRFTRELLDQTGEFTVNIPMGGLDPQALVFCGRNSGRDVDKIHKMDFHLEEPMNISVPGIRELPLTLECRVLYHQLQDCKGLPQEIMDRYYPAVREDGTPDRHIAYTAEIVNAYIIQD